MLGAQTAQLVSCTEAVSSLDWSGFESHLEALCCLSSLHPVNCQSSDEATIKANDDNNKI